MSHPLFIYGTLHPDRAPAAIASTARLLKPLDGGTNRATIQGSLYNLGEYPGVILSATDKSSRVAGELFSLPEDLEAAEVILARLDAYEDFRPADPANSLFLRQQVLATRLDGPGAGTGIVCWVYTYNQPVETPSA